MLHINLLIYYYHFTDMLNNIFLNDHFFLKIKKSIKKFKKFINFFLINNEFYSQVYLLYGYVT
jgi:hypothetical protein